MTYRELELARLTLCRRTGSSGRGLAVGLSGGAGEFDMMA